MCPPLLNSDFFDEKQETPMAQQIYQQAFQIRSLMNVNMLSVRPSSCVASQHSNITFNKVVLCIISLFTGCAPVELWDLPADGLSFLANISSLNDNCCSVSNLWWLKCWECCSAGHYTQYSYSHVPHCMVPLLVLGHASSVMNPVDMNQIQPAVWESAKMMEHGLEVPLHVVHFYQI